MAHDILHPLPGLESKWHEATALRYHAPTFACEFHGGLLLFSRHDWMPVHWGDGPATIQFLQSFRLPAVRTHHQPKPDIDLSALIGDLL